jgi:hypothetical protein
MPEACRFLSAHRNTAVTLQISPAMRDDVDALAQDLQRAKTTKDERITANTVMRYRCAALDRQLRL